LKGNLPDVVFSRELEKVVSGSRCVVITTDHSEYRSLQPRTLTAEMTLPGGVVDCRHVFEPKSFTDSKLLYRGLGHPLSL